MGGLGHCRRFPVLRKKLSNLASLHIIYPGQYVGIPVNRIVPVALGSRDECQMNCDSLSALVRAGEEAVFSHKDPAFNGSFRFIVVDRDLRIFQESGKCQPVLQCVIDRFPQLVGGVKSAFGADNHVPQAFYQLLRVSAPHSQSVGRSLAFTVPLDLIQVSVNVQDIVAYFGGGKLDFEIPTPGMRVATRFGSLLAVVESIKTVSSIGLDNAFVVRQEFAIPGEGLVFRKVVHGDLALGTDVGCDFPLPNIVFMTAVLNLDERVVGFDDRGPEQFFLLKVVQQGKRVGRGLHPITLRGAWNGDAVATENFMLPIVGESVVELADNDLGQEPRSSVAAGNGWRRLLSSHNVLPALGAGAGFLAMLNDLQACAYHFKLVSELAVNAVSLNRARRTDCFFGANKVRHLLVRQMAGIIEDMFLAARLSFRRGRSSFVRGLRLRLYDGGSRTRIMFFGSLAVLFLVVLFCLDNEDVEFRLQVLHQLAQFLVTVESLLQLPPKILEQMGESFNFLLSSKVLFSQLCVFVFHCGTNGGINQSIPLYDLVFMESRKKAPYLMPINVECLRIVYYVSSNYRRWLMNGAFPASAWLCRQFWGSRGPLISVLPAISV